ncbi:nitroreductase family protein [Geminocystis sp. CENA526]|uniref:nitroreductase family protein n=1 Tax=Geminocystis sp. CENA526 TaxID=1355871 RepID=UPI003D6E0B05
MFIKLIKKTVPEPVLSTLKTSYFKIGGLCDYVILNVARLSPWLSSFYYFLGSSQFQREHYAVVRGKLNYYYSLNSGKSKFYLLRRNIHRLEKGLIMKPRREIFALEYIQETIEAYEDILQNKTEFEDEQQLRWFHDVLSEYFNIVSSHPLIDNAKNNFLEIENKYTITKGNFIPYQRNLNIPPSINYDQFLELCYRRRSVRWYLQKPVSRELLDKAVAAATLSPSACNRQPFEFRIFDEPELVQKVASLAGGVRGFVHNFPVIIVVIGQLRAYFDEKDRHLIYIDSSLSSMSLMFALETMGLSSCAINWADIPTPEKKMKKLLNLADDERPIMLISVGYPDPEGKVPYSQKKALDQIRKYN